MQTYVHATLGQKAKTQGLILRKIAEKTCHGCGLEAEDCPEKHIPSLDTEPCLSCFRNPKTREYGRIYKDNFDEAWTLNENNQPFIER